MAHKTFVGVLGTAEVEPDLIVEAVADWLESLPEETEITFYFALTPDLWTPSVVAVRDLVAENEIPYNVVVGNETLAAKYKKIQGEAEKTLKVANPTLKLVKEIAKADQAYLLLADDESNDDVNEAVMAATEEEITCLDLANALEPIEFLSGEDEEEVDEEEAEEAQDEPTEASGTYSEADLEALELDALKEICAERDIQVPLRSRKPTYIRLILEAQDAEPDDVPQEEEQSEEVPEAQQDTATVLTFPVPEPDGFFYLSGNCKVCGSPIFAPGGGLRPDQATALRTCPPACEFSKE